MRWRCGWLEATHLCSPSLPKTPQRNGTQPATTRPRTKSLNYSSLASSSDGAVHIAAAAAKALRDKQLPPPPLPALVAAAPAPAPAAPLPAVVRSQSHGAADMLPNNRAPARPAVAEPAPTTPTAEPSTTTTARPVPLPGTPHMPVDKRKHSASTSDATPAALPRAHSTTMAPALPATVAKLKPAEPATPILTSPPADVAVGSPARIPSTTGSSSNASASLRVIRQPKVG